MVRGVYTNSTKKGLNDLDNHEAVVTHLEADITQCEVKRALGSITTKEASGGERIPAKLFKILKLRLLKCCTQYASTFGKLSMATRLEKVSFHSHLKEWHCQRMFQLLDNWAHFIC